MLNSRGRLKVETKIFKKFQKLIDEREKRIKYHFGDNFYVMINQDDERLWYSKNIFPIDKKIVKFSNLILKELLKKQETVTYVVDVYENKILMNWYKRQQNNLEKEF